MNDDRIHAHVEDDLTRWPRITGDDLEQFVYGLLACAVFVLVLLAMTSTT